MADIELVIKIPEEVKNRLCFGVTYAKDIQTVCEALHNGTSLPKGHCKDCKWWKDSDGLYRRGNHAESQCPINRREVFEGNGYCYMYEPQESERV